MSESSTAKRFFAAAAAELSQLGLRRHGRGLYTWVVQEEVLGWLGLNIAGYSADHMVDVNPVVGVRHQSVHRLLADLTQRKFDKHSPPTYSLPLGYLTPEKEFRQWTFWADRASADAFDERWVDWDDVFRDMLMAFQRYGIPFVERLKSISDVCREMSGDPGADPFVFPVVSFLVGDVSGGRTAIEKEIAKREEHLGKAIGEGREHAERYLIDYRGFAAQLLAHFAPE